MSQAQSQTGPWTHAAALGAVLVGGWLALSPLLAGWFWGGDDWLHLEHARLFADGHPFAALRDRLFDYYGSGQAALRQTSTVLWGLDFLLFGADPRGYYGTNIALHLLNAALAYALAYRWGRSAFAAAVCAALYILNARTTEVVWFLAVRSETLALTLCLAAVLGWPRARRSWRGRAGVAALFAAALFAKATAGVLPLLLLTHDLATLPSSERLRPGRLLRHYAPLGLALALYAGAVFALLDLGTTLGYVPDAQVSRLAEARIVLGEARAVLLAPHWTASYGAVAVPLWSELRQWLLLGMIAAGALAWRGPRPLWALGAVWLFGGLVLPWGLLARGMSFGRYFLPSTLGLGLLVAAAIVALEARAWSRWPGRGLAAAAVIASGLAFSQPEALRFHADLGRGVQSAIAALERSVTDRGPIRDLYVVLPSSMRGIVELVQRERTLDLLLPGGGAPERVFLLGEGTTGLMAERPQLGPRRGGVPDCNDFLPLGGEFELDGVDYSAGDRVLYLATSPSGDEGTTPRFAVFDSAPTPAPTGQGAFGGPTRSLWVLSAPDAAGAWSHTGFGEEHRPEALPRLGPHGLRLSTAAPVGARTLWHTLLNHGPAALVSPALDLVAANTCELVIDLTVTPRGRPAVPEVCALEPARFAVLFWSDELQADAVFRRHMVLPLQAHGRPETLRINLRNSPPWMAADRVRRLALVPSSTPADVVLQRVEVLGCGFETTP